MRNGSRLRAQHRQRGHYRPAHAWLGRPGDGVPLRRRRSSSERWRFRWKQLRVLLLAALLGALAWSQIWKSDAARAPVAAERSAR